MNVFIIFDKRESANISGMIDVYYLILLYKYMSIRNILSTINLEEEWHHRIRLEDTRMSASQI